MNIGPDDPITITLARKDWAEIWSTLYTQAETLESIAQSFSDKHNSDASTVTLDPYAAVAPIVDRAASDLYRLAREVDPHIHANGPIVRDDDGTPLYPSEAGGEV